MTQIAKLTARCAVLALVIIGSLAVVVAVNTLRMPSRQMTVPEIEVRRFDADRAIERFQEAIRFPTVSHANPARVDEQQFRELHAYLEEAFPAFHQTVTKCSGDALDEERNFTRLYRWEGSEPELPALLLMAHLDVVPVAADVHDQWSQPPFGGALADGYVWGRGTLDAKDGAVAMLEAAEQLISEGFRPRQTIYLSFGHDEETGGIRGNRQVASWMQQRGIRLKFILDEGGCIMNDLPGVTAPVALIGIAEKGHLNVRLVVEAEGGHASMPPRMTAVGILAKAIERLENNPMPQRLDGGIGFMLDFTGPEMSLLGKVAMANRWLFAPLIKRQLAAKPSGNALLRTTMAATMLEAGVTPNVLPTRAEALLNVRILQGDSSASVLKHIKAVIGDERVEVKPGMGQEPSPISSTESDGFVRLHQTVREVFPDVLVAPFVLVGGTDSSHFSSFGCNTYRFIPARLSSGDLSRIHGIDERISHENYSELVRFYARLIENSTPLRVSRK